MDEYMLQEAVPMNGRMVHSPDGHTKLLPYSGRKGEYINSISRGGLNIALMNEAERQPGVTFHFQKKCAGFDGKSGAVRFGDGDVVTPDTTIATDGAGSIVRDAMLHVGIERFNFSQQWLEHGYKELHIPPAENSGFRLEKNALHIWPRHQFMMIALPNWDGSFTCTLFLAHRSAEASDAAFDELTNETAVRDFFEREFPDAVPLMPTLVDDFFHNPTGNLGTIKCFPWNAGGKALLLGDSAHAVVPFYGQGMNCAFEDCRELLAMLDTTTDWASTFRRFEAQRRPHTDAIADMAIENYLEMRDTVRDPQFHLQKTLSLELERRFPQRFVPRYSMVMFHDEIPYAVALERGRIQNKILQQLTRNVSTLGAVDFQAAQRMIEERLTPISPQAPK